MDALEILQSLLVEVMIAFNPSTWDVGAGTWLQVQGQSGLHLYEIPGQPGLHRKMVSQ